MQKNASAPAPAAWQHHPQQVSDDTFAIDPLLPGRLRRLLGHLLLVLLEPHPRARRKLDELFAALRDARLLLT